MKSNGYILVLTLMMLSIITLIATRLFYQASVTIQFDQVMLERQQAQALARGGIELAYSQLFTVSGRDEKKPEEQTLENIIPSLNRWQEYTLKKDIDGIDAEIRIAISCEQGKIDLNQLFDFKEKKFKGNQQTQEATRQQLQALFKNITKYTKKDLFPSLEKFLKKRDHPLNEVTELLTIPAFQKAFEQDIFYEPPSRDTQEQKNIFLTDLFTVHNNRTNVQPWFLSHSLALALQFKPTSYGDTQKRKNHIKNIAKEFKGFSQLPGNIWEKQLKPLYGRDIKGLPKSLQRLLEGTFTPNTFSVLSSAKVGAISQKIFAIIEKLDDPSKSKDFIVKNLYWL